MRVLLVDDEENILWSLQRALSNEGFGVFGAHNVVEARAVLEKEPVDVVVTDLRMPGGDGFDLLRWVREHRPDTRLIMATAFGSTAVKEAALRQGALHFLEKPVNIGTLSQMLKDMQSREGFEATLRNMGLFDLLQLIMLARGSRTIEVRNAGERGVLSFQKGELLGAAAGELTGETAFFRIMGWQTGDFREISMPVVLERNIKLSTQELLFEAARVLDETARQAPAPSPAASAPATEESNEPPMPPPSLAVIEKPASPDPKPVNIDNAVQIAPDVYWVGHRNPRALLQINVYLRVFRGASSTVNMLVDPGSPVDLPVISKKVGQVIGDIGKVQLFTLNHQDPDVVANSVFIQRMNPRALCICSEDTWRLVSHYELDPARVRLTDKFKDGKMRLQTGHTVQFLRTPYCHFRGAVAPYDVENRVLFTGDLLGGMSSEQHRGLYATEASWEGVKLFHQIYMPSRKVLQHAVAAIRRLDPQPLIIAPQHGDILRGPMIEEFLSRIENLPVGADLFEDATETRAATLLRDAANELLTFAVELLGQDSVQTKLEVPGTRTRVGAIAAMSGTSVTTVYKAMPELLTHLQRALCLDEPIEVVNQLRMAAIKVAVQRNLPVATSALDGDLSIIEEAEEDVLM